MDQPKRRLSAVWFADIVGYSTLSSRDEPAALDLVRALQELARAVVAEHEGRVVKFIGDAVLAEFGSTESAVRGAVSLQERYQRAATGRGIDSKLRVGVHLGEVNATAHGDLYGDGINTAARLQHEAQPGQVIVSEDVWRQLRQRPEFRFASLGPVELRGITTAVEVYDVLFGARAALACQPTPAAPAPAAARPPAAPTVRRGPSPAIGAALGLVALAIAGVLAAQRWLGGSTPVPAAAPRDPAPSIAAAAPQPSAGAEGAGPVPPAGSAPAPAPTRTAAPGTRAGDSAAALGPVPLMPGEGVIDPRRGGLPRLRVFLEEFVRALNNRPPRQVLGALYPGAPPATLRSFQQMRETVGPDTRLSLGQIEPVGVQGDTAEIRFTILAVGRPQESGVRLEARIAPTPRGLRFTALRRAGPGG